MLHAVLNQEVGNYLDIVTSSSLTNVFDSTKRVIIVVFQSLAVANSHTDSRAYDSMIIATIFMYLLSSRPSTFPARGFHVGHFHEFVLGPHQSIFVAAPIAEVERRSTLCRVLSWLLE